MTSASTCSRRRDSCGASSDWTTARSSRKCARSPRKSSREWSPGGRSATRRRSPACSTRSVGVRAGSACRRDARKSPADHRAVPPTKGGRTMLGTVAKLTVKPGMEKEFEAVAKELVAKVNANEPGCKLYALHRMNETPNVYVFMERYTDQAAVEAHRATDYFKALGRKMGEYMEGRAEVMRMTEVE